MQKMLSTLVITLVLTACTVTVSAQNKDGNKGYLQKQTVGHMPTESLTRNTPHSQRGIPELTCLTGVLKDIYVENWGELVLLDAGNTALYNDASTKSYIMETPTGKGYLSIEGPVVLPCVGRKNGWFAVEHPTEHTVGWVSGGNVRMACQTDITERQQNRLYRFGEWEMMCVAVNKATGLALGYVQRRKGHEARGKSLRQIVMGKVLDGAYVFHYFADVDIIRRNKQAPHALTVVRRERDGMFDIRVGKDWLIPAYSHLNMIDLQRLPSPIIEELFGEAIKEAKPLDAQSYLFVTSELLCDEKIDNGLH